MPTSGGQPLGGLLLVMEGGAEVDTLIFDVDDTLYPVGCGFTGHRNVDVVREFMVQRLCASPTPTLSR